MANTDERKVYDPHRSVSSQLTEVRTVLNRARSALETLAEQPTWTVVKGSWDHSVKPPVFVGEVRENHPDHEDMTLALARVIELLEPWERAGKRRSSRHGYS
jgi:hypothetical protein